MVNVKDLKKGNYYRYYYDNGRYLVGKCKTNGDFDCYYAAGDKIKMNRYSNDYWGDSNFCASTSWELATQEEIDWLEQCHSEGSWIPFVKNKELQIEIW